MEHLLLTVLLALVGIAAIAIALTLIPAAIVKHGMRSRLSQQSRGRLALTFDDGPGPFFTPPLLELLERYGAKASFFLVGFRADRFPQQADAMKAAGHEMGNHTHSHRNAWRVLPWAAVRDMRQGYESMSRWMTGDAPFRPPFGKLVTWTMLAARRRGAALSFWTHDGGDTWPTIPDPKSIAATIERDGGGVVLLHSHDRGDDRQRYVLAVIECLLQTARRRGWRICTMTEILNVATDDATESRAGGTLVGGAS